jgi:hypothetical protein
MQFWDLIHKENSVYLIVESKFGALSELHPLDL